MPGGENGDRMKKCAIALRLLGLTVIAYLLAEGVFLLASSPLDFSLKSPRVVGANAATRTVAVASRLADYDVIGRRNLLGAQHASEETYETGVDSLPESRLNWKLLGTVMSGDASLRRAVTLINGQQKILKENDEEDNWLIARVEREAVVLVRGEMREVLRADAPALATTGGSVGPARTVSRAALRAGLGNPGAMAREASFVPAVYGQQKGVRLLSLSESSLLASLGLEKGDLLLKANAVRLESLADLAAMTGLINESAIELTVLRGNQEVVFRYEIKE